MVSGLLSLSICVAGCRIRRVDKGERSPSAQQDRPAQQVGGTARAPETLSEPIPLPDGGATEVGLAGGPGELMEPTEDQGGPISRPSGDPVPESDAEGAADLEESRGVKRALPDGFRILAFAGGAEFPAAFDDLVLASVGASASPAEAAAQVAERLESFPSTNAGVGSALRLDGTTIECDALVIDSTGRKGFAGGLRSSKAPVSVAAALYRAGGATVRGTAADELARRLGGGDAVLLTQGAEAAYLGDLRLHAGRPSGHGPGSLESLYVSPEKLSTALASAPEPRRSALDRLPIFVIVSDGNTVALAASSGGIALSHPGAPSLLDAPHNAFSLNEEGASVVLASNSTCPDGAVKASQQLLTTRSSLLSALSVKATCKDAPFVILAGDTLRTNIPGELLYVRGEGLEEREPPQQASPAAQPLVRPTSPGERTLN